MGRKEVKIYTYQETVEADGTINRVRVLADTATGLLVPLSTEFKGEVFGTLGRVDKRLFLLKDTQIQPHDEVEVDGQVYEVVSVEDLLNRRIPKLLLLRGVENG